MENFLKKPIKIRFSQLFLDPNNPRLANEEAPGYDNPIALFKERLQAEAEKSLETIYKPEDLINSIITQGWMPIDNIVVWPHPDDPDKFIVVEGNTRTLSLRKIRKNVLPEERSKLNKMEARPKKYTSYDLDNQRKLVRQLDQVVEDTEEIVVVPLDAGTTKELQQKLPRVHAVRHILGAKTWGGYAEDLWLFERYKHLYEDKYPGQEIQWNNSLISVVAGETSTPPRKIKQKMLATAAFSHFIMNYENRLPEGEEIKPRDYYLFEIIARNKWLSSEFGLQDNDFHLSEEGEKALFEWVFKQPRSNRDEDDNPNVIYRHENIRDWASMRTYDTNNKTDFSYRLNVLKPETAPSYRSIEAAWNSHKAIKQPQAVVDELIQKLKKFDADTLFNSGHYLKDQLTQIRMLADKCIRAIEANENP